MKILKIRTVKTPHRGTPGSAGIDFFVPEEVGLQLIAPGKSAFIASGIKAKVPKGFALIAMNKSGVALKGLQVGACVVDEDYQGEIHLHVTNISADMYVKIDPGMKLLQMLLVPISLEGIEEVGSEEELFEGEETERGSGGFGSTGIK